MAINVLDVKPNKVPTNPEAYSQFIYGPAKIGKTTLAFLRCMASVDYS